MTTHREMHKAQDDMTGHCTVCGQHVRIVAGGSGPVAVHSDSGMIAAPNPPGVLPEQQAMALAENMDAQARADATALNLIADLLLNPMPMALLVEDITGIIRSTGRKI